MIRIFLTGAGGAASISLLKHLQGDARYELFAGDIDPRAAGLYLVPAERRVILPRGDDPAFAGTLLEVCGDHAIDVLIPTVDVELEPVALGRARFEAAGTRVLLAPLTCLQLCLDKWKLMEAVGRPHAPRSAPLTADLDVRSWEFPVLVKPRTGAGGRGVRVVETREEFLALPRDPAMLVQEYLPGAEYSVDVLVAQDGTFLAAVPRERLKVDSGVAVACRTVRDPELEAAARAVAERIGVTGVANVQFRRDRAGRPRLMEVNARFPGTMPLSVAAGVDMPSLALEDLVGRGRPEGVLPFEEVALVRTWQEHAVDPSVFVSFADSAELAKSA